MCYRKNRRLQQESGDAGGTDRVFDLTMTPKRMSSLVWSFGWISVAIFTMGSAGADQIAFIGVNVIPVDGDRVLEDYSVIVEDGRIVAMGPRLSTSPAAEATLIEGEGKYLIPGLADMHIHLLNQEFMTAVTRKDDPIQPIENMLYLYLANGVTTVRVMAGFPELLALRDAIERGEVLGPRLIVTTPMFDGKKPFWPALGRPIPSPEAARSAVRESKKDGYDMIKVYTLLRRDAYDAVIEEAEKVNLKVVGHVPIAVGLEHALESGQDEVTHVEEFWRFTRDYSDEVIAKFTAMAVKSGVWFSPTMTTYQDQMVSLEAELNRSENRFLDPARVGFLGAAHESACGRQERPKSERSEGEACTDSYWVYASFGKEHVRRGSTAYDRD